MSQYLAETIANNKRLQQKHKKYFKNQNHDTDITGGMIILKVTKSKAIKVPPATNDGYIGTNAILA